jgi:hypothetical protein
MGRRNVRVLGWLTLVAALSLVIASLFPMSYAVCPDWEVTVVDAAGMPMSGITVRRVCQDSVEATGHEDDAITDERGKASFKGKYLTTLRLFSWVGNVLNVATQGFHAPSFGRHAHVFVGRRMQGDPVTINGYLDDWTGSPEHMESTIVVKPVQEIPSPRIDLISERPGIIYL